MVAKKKRSSRKASITPAQRSARRKNMAIARAARESKGYSKTFASEYKKGRKSGMSKEGAVSSAITGTQWKHQIFGGKYGSKLSKLSKVNRRRSFKEIKLPYDPGEVAFKKKWTGARR